MSPVESLEDAGRRRLHELTEAAGERFGNSVRAVVIGSGGSNPEIVGTCILIEIEERKYALTAAHILDNLDSHEIYVVGKPGTQPVQLVGESHTTALPHEGRDSDQIDIGFWELNQSAIERLGEVQFIDSSRFSNNRPPLDDKFYMAMGYPISRNKRGVKKGNRTIQTTPRKYTGQLCHDLAFAREYPAPDDKHLFLSFQKYSETDVGEKRRTFEPFGLSGGPLIDLGDLASPQRFLDDPQDVGHIAGVIIEKVDKHPALVATRIQVVVEAIQLTRKR